MFKIMHFRLPILASLTALFLGTSSGTAFAVTAAGSFGEMVCNAFDGTTPFGHIFNWVAYVAGAAFTLQAIHHFRLHSEDPRNNPLQRPVLLALGAMGLLVMPYLLGTIIFTLYGAAGAGGALTCSPGPAGGAATGTDLAQMMDNFMNNIKQPMTIFVSAIAIVSGVFMMVRGLMKASKYGFDPKTHAIHTILANIGFGAVLFTIGTNLNMMLDSVFGTTTIASTSLGWTLPGGAPTAAFTQGVAAALSFVQVIGVIAFVRGWMILKKVVEGGGNTTMAQGITHILGGVMAINIGGFLKIMDNTFGTGLLS